MGFRFPSHFYPIIDPAGRADRDHLMLARAVLAAGARILQLRVKQRPTAELVALARAVRELTSRAGALLIINDRADVAKLVGADGVHLGQSDLGVNEARTILGPAALIGWSTHSRAQAAAAQRSGADYLGFGPIFATTSKADPDPVQGVEQLRLVCGESDLPVVAIGGLTVETMPAVLAAGAAAVALIGEISHASDPQQRAAEILRLLD